MVQNAIYLGNELMIVWEPCKFVMVQNLYGRVIISWYVWEPCKFVMVQNIFASDSRRSAVWEPCKFVMVQNSVDMYKINAPFENLVSL